MAKKLIGTLLLATVVSMASFADNPIKKKNQVRKGYKTTTIAKTEKSIKTNDDLVVTKRSRKGAYHIQNTNGVTNLADAQGVNAGKTVDQTTVKYPYMKWSK
ncbi:MULTISPECIES: hypothetical protein [Flammeovirga]|uniref:Uncharacterized protein n=1 Tax=Flammeovirga agarivorans TaxID=2726742 RepID=A0A7X8XYF4_9BACT|nr:MULTISPECIES: hypothetical protein [Flammeovirga]NLR93980.1 hypothetical protein [Flammeovirga agarivorans]